MIYVTIDVEQLHPLNSCIFIKQKYECKIMIEFG